MFDFFKNTIRSFFKIVFGSIKTLASYWIFLSCYVYDILSYIFGVNVSFKKNETAEIYAQYKHTQRAALRRDIRRLIRNPKFFYLNKIESNLFYSISTLFINDKNNSQYTLPRFYYRSKNYAYKPYSYKNQSNLYTTFNTIRTHFLYGYASIWKALRTWILSLVIALGSLYFLSLIRILPVNAMLFQWFVLGMFSYWLISGFVFFIKKYRFTRFTSAIQRFWRRSYILFWLIESCLLLVFFYLTFNASQESSYMLDQVQVFKTHLFSWRSFLPKLFLVTALVILGYILLLNVKFNIFKKNIPMVMLITVLLTYLLWIEFYQIYHVSNFYANLFWSYDVDDRLWSLESDARRTRIVNHYVMILFLLKFWHIVFIYIFWIFFILRTNELERIRYPIYSANFQNFIILYIMSWIFMYPWIKFVLHRFIEMPYFWFYVNNRELGLRVFVQDIRLVYYGITSYFYNNINSLFFFKNTDFIYWILSDETSNFTAYRKHMIRDYITKELIK
jgi:hypothetical protein